MERFLERIAAGIIVRVASSQINGAINRRRNQRRTSIRPGLPRNRHTPAQWAAAIVLLVAVLAVATVLLPH